MAIKSVCTKQHFLSNIQNIENFFSIQKQSDADSEILIPAYTKTFLRSVQNNN